MSTGFMITGGHHAYRPPLATRLPAGRVRCKGADNDRCAV